jgi:hypothetical protein
MRSPVEVLCPPIHAPAASPRLRLLLPCLLPDTAAADRRTPSARPGGYCWRAPRVTGIAGSCHVFSSLGHVI